MIPINKEYFFISLGVTAIHAIILLGYFLGLPIPDFVGLIGLASFPGLAVFTITLLIKSPKWRKVFHACCFVCTVGLFLLGIGSIIYGAIVPGIRAAGWILLGFLMSVAGVIFTVSVIAAVVMHKRIVARKDDM